ncbi:MAG: 5-aminolevulic acid synthase [Gemmobacter sp.]
MFKVMGAVLVVLVAGTAMAEPMGSDAARKALLSTKGVAVEVTRHKALSEAEVKAVAMVAEGQVHYGAVAFSPGDGLMTEATVAAIDFHSTEAAAAAAAAECDAKRKARTPCAVVALIRPAGWEPRPIQMSAAAAAAFRKDYGRNGPRAMALSQSTGKFGLGKGRNAQADALAACNKDVPAADCVVMIAD